MVQIAEHGLLGLAGIRRARDQHHAMAEAHRDHGGGAATVNLRIGHEARRLDHGEIRIEPGKVFLRRPDEHVAAKQIVPGELVYDANAQAKVRIGAGIGVAYEQFAALQIRHDAAMQALKRCWRHLLVDSAPLNRRIGQFVPDNELVLRRSSSVLTRGREQCATSSEFGFATTDRGFVEGFNRQVPVNTTGIGYASGAQGGVAFHRFSLCYAVFIHLTRAFTRLETVANVA